MATVPTGYVFWDVSAKKSYAAGTTFPALGNGDYMVPATTTQDGYYHSYWYYTSNSTWGEITFTDGWIGQIDSNGNYKGLAQKVPFNSIADKPVRVFTYSGTFSSWPSGASQSGYSTFQSLTNLQHLSFNGCANLSGTAPNMPTSIVSLNSAFVSTKITAPPSNFNSLTNLEKAKNTFYGVTTLTTVPAMAGCTKLVDCAGMFYNCTNITSVPSLPPNLDNAYYMFQKCSKLTTIPTIPASVTNARTMFESCTKIVTPPEFASGSNVYDISYMYQNCTSLTSAPVIPDSVGLMIYTFKNCTSLSGNIRIESDIISNSYWCFENIVNQLILLGPSINYSKLKSIANNYTNVYAGVVALPSSLTAIRGIYDPEEETFVETINGTYCKLTLNYTAPYVVNAKFMLPTVTNKNNEELDLTWHLNTVDGSIIGSSGYQIQEHGTIISIIDLESSDTSDVYTLTNNTEYSYNGINYEWVSGTITATLTYSNALIDINPLGTGIAFWGEIADDYIGMIIKKNINIDGQTTTNALKVDNHLIWIGTRSEYEDAVDEGEMPEHSIVFITDETADYVVEQGTSGAWKYRKWNSGYVEARALASHSSLSWASYPTGLYYNTPAWTVNYPFAIYDPCISATVVYCGGNVGWVTVATHASDTASNVSIVRNGNTGQVLMDFIVRGRWK